MVYQVVTVRMRQGIRDVLDVTVYFYNKQCYLHRYTSILSFSLCHEDMTFREWGRV